MRDPGLHVHSSRRLLLARGTRTLCKSSAALLSLERSFHSGAARASYSAHLVLVVPTFQISRSHSATAIAGVASSSRVPCMSFRSGAPPWGTCAFPASPHRAMTRDSLSIRSSRAFAFRSSPFHLAQQCRRRLAAPVSSAVGMEPARPVNGGGIAWRACAHRHLSCSWLLSMGSEGHVGSHASGTRRGRGISGMGCGHGGPPLHVRVHAHTCVLSRPRLHITCRHARTWFRGCRCQAPVREPPRRTRSSPQQPAASGPSASAQGAAMSYSGPHATEGAGRRFLWARTEDEAAVRTDLHGEAV